jgi:hypothetical protein
VDWSNPICRNLLCRSCYVPTSWSVGGSIEVEVQVFTLLVSILPVLLLHSSWGVQVYVSIRSPVGECLANVEGFAVVGPV